MVHYCADYYRAHRFRNDFYFALASRSSCCAIDRQQSHAGYSGRDNFRSYQQFVSSSPLRTMRGSLKIDAAYFKLFTGHSGKCAHT